MDSRKTQTERKLSIRLWIRRALSLVSWPPVCRHAICGPYSGSTNRIPSTRTVVNPM
ncbi:MAG: hypothetical protein HYS13_09375 [Planctomycetia bacterium]|nr:hypothetical protein [Planctomycetia bacterium]